MFDPSMMTLYVDSPAASAGFYSDLLGRAPVEASPTFALFVLGSGVQFALWSRHTVAPGASAAGGGGELGFKVADAPAVEAVHADWKARGLPMLQGPTEQDFGHSFVALDPDGHRLRVYAVHPD